MLEFGLASIFGLIDDGTNFFLHITIRPDQPQQTSYDIYHVTTSFLSGNLIAIFINDVRRKIYIEVGLRARAAIGIIRREA